ncbi:hypothetical protein OAL49_08540 [Gammaproteobacteria bacterium]|nr:hypothetical protein [Gammaproteobacteria bacterium]
MATLLRSEPDVSLTRVRIWVVDLDHQSWIERGDGNAFWLTRWLACQKSHLFETARNEAISPFPI